HLGRLVQLPPAALGEALPARLHALPANLLAGRDDQYGVELVLHAGLEQQRHLADQERRRRPCRRLLGEPLAPSPADARMEQPLEEHQAALLREGQLCEGDPVDLAVADRAWAEALADGGDDLRIAVEVVDD